MLSLEELNRENIEGKQENPESDEQEILASFDFLTEILSRLPVKSLLRFKSVSKSWFSLICSPEFIKSHLSLSAKNNNTDYTNYRVMLRIAQPEFNLKDCSLKSLLHDESVIEESDLDYPMKDSSISFLIEGSVNGLICLVRGAEELVLWNPSIKTYKKLPVLRSKMRDSYRSTYGFGYDEIHDDYKVVCIISRLHDFKEVNMYSLKNNSWQKIDCPRNGARLINSGEFVNGRLHWAATADLGLERGWSITSFDLANEKWRKVERPCYREERDGVLVLGALGSNVSMICNNSTIQVDVWIMNEYGVKESWTKMFTINYTIRTLVDYLFSQFFCLSKRGEFLLRLESVFLICNPKDNSIRFPEYAEFSDGLLAEIYIESLVCPLSQNEPRTQQLR
ncbi:F-box/kelch-repeat protein At3g23880-like [Lycium barbarum]|uniref:F-box/kelch-repeat protein At3g23880-like n=1 Tax=Lycium barbarum TaxID=112863 RepID=UPI00293F78A3|nr:F-box/kelch-repeat protein At3g23880-like [Lycium barbarum]